MRSYNKKYLVIQTYGLLAVDLLSVSISYLAAYLLRFGPTGFFSDGDNWFRIYLVCMLVCLVYNLVTDGYHHFFRRGYFEEAVYVLKYNVVLLALVSTGLYVFRLEMQFSRLLLGYFIVLNVLLTYVFRYLFKRFMSFYYRKSKSSDKVLIVTTSGQLEQILKNLEEDEGWSYEVIGIAVLDRNRIGETSHNIPIVANRENVVDIARQNTVDVVFLHCPSTPLCEIEVLIQSFLAMGIVCHNCVERVNVDTPHSAVGKFAAFPVITYAMTVIDYRQKIIKRMMDILGGMVGLLFTAIITPFVALAIQFDSRGPVFFSQVRIGKNGRRFRIYKFRSMYVDAEERKKELQKQNEMQGLMFKMKRDPRVTRVGGIIRRTSIDELPQFWNVLKGDMSLVGTRPPTEEEFDRYNIYYKRRLSITPGMTGMWQVSGRSEITDFEDVVKLDLEYIDDWSLRKDIKILLLTVWVVFFGKGSR